MEAGLDSLAAVELRNRIASSFEVDLPATLTFDYPSITALAQYLGQYNTMSSNLAVPESVSLRKHITEKACQIAYAEGADSLNHFESYTAITSISSRYPGAENAAAERGDSFWRAFYLSADLQTVVPFSRWDMERAYVPYMNSGDGMKFYTRFAAFCAGVEFFDAAAFRLSTPEVVAMDPQIRILMEKTAEACSAPSTILYNNTLSGTGGVGRSVGVYVGCMYHEHLDVVMSTASKLSPQVIVGNGAPYMIGRLSYTFGFSGPCVSTDTACSSSLVGTHLAHTALHNFECSAAVAAGTNIMLQAGTTSAICQLQALSPAGRCKTFEASADGYGRGEGFAVLIMQRQEHTVSAQQPVAVLRASAVNQGGRSSGLTAPNGPAQTALIRSTLAADTNGIDVNLLAAVSIHGTGTPLGDPIEVGALAQAFSQTTGNGDNLGSSERTSQALISNKSCFGHTEGAAGITGLLAALGLLNNQAMPAMMHLRNPNSYVETALADWKQRCGVGPSIPRQQGPSAIAMSAANQMLASA